VAQPTVYGSPQGRSLTGGASVVHDAATSDSGMHIDAGNIRDAGGSLADVAAHMGRQPAIRELEEKLDEHLLEPRDLSDPEGARTGMRSSNM